MYVYIYIANSPEKVPKIALDPKPAMKRMPISCCKKKRIKKIKLQDLHGSETCDREDAYKQKKRKKM
jgi:hypothetical protein